MTAMGFGDFVFLAVLAVMVITPTVLLFLAKRRSRRGVSLVETASTNAQARTIIKTGRTEFFLGGNRPESDQTRMV